MNGNAQPDRVEWSVAIPAERDQRQTRQVIRDMTRTDRLFVDDVVGFEGNTAVHRSVDHHLSDYFTRISISESVPNAVIVTFQRKPEAKRFWKDAMLWVIRAIKSEHLDVKPLTRAQGQDLSSVPAQRDEGYYIERWLPRLGQNSTRFWRMAAEYSRETRQFTFLDLSSFSKISVERLRAGHRNSYRLIKAAGARDPLQLVRSLNHGLKVYHLPDEVREQIFSLLRR